MPEQQRIDAVLDYWFGELTDDGMASDGKQSLWVQPQAGTDDDIRSRFGDDVQRALDGKLASWTSTPRGSIALVLLLDQFPRNIYRGQRRCFARDGRARYLMRDGMSRLMDLELSPIERSFFYMPLQHSEFLEDQESSVARYEQLLREVDTTLRPEFESFLAGGGETFGQR